jgi:hypothetical protein
LRIEEEKLVQIILTLPSPVSQIRRRQYRSPGQPEGAAEPSPPDLLVKESHSSLALKQQGKERQGVDRASE